MAIAVRILSTVDEVRALGVELATVSELALDTEFHGEHRYTPELMLVQIATRDQLVLVDRLGAQLAARERLAWVEEECAVLCTAERYALRDPDEAWTRVKRPKRPMSATANGVLRALAAERERIARDLDAPPTRVLHDDLL